MKVVIPAKANSERIKNKNFRKFYQNLSLVDILLEKLLKIFQPNNIFVSCEDLQKKNRIEKWGVNFHLRDKNLVKNDVPWSKVICEIAKGIPGDDDIMWCLVTDPLFNSYQECIQVWEKIDKKRYDSLVVVYPRKTYVMNCDFEPLNFGLGDKHIPTQYIKPVYFLHNTLFIIDRNTLEENKYYIGKKPYWYEATNYSIDIDNEVEFKIAQLIYASFRSYSCNELI